MGTKNSQMTIFIREAFQTKKQRNFGLGQKRTPPPNRHGTVFNLGCFEVEWPPKNSSRQVEYEKYWYKIKASLVQKVD